MHVIKRKKNIRSKFFTTIKKKVSTRSSSCIKPETRTSNSHFKHLPGGASGTNARVTGWIPGLGRPPGEANGNPLQYSCLENSIDRGAWWATVHGLQRVGHNWLTNTLQGEGKGHLFKLMASTQCNMRQNDLQIEGSREWGLEGGGECLWHLLQGPFPKESRTGRSQTWRNRLLIFSISLPLYAFSFWHFSAYWSLFQSEQRKKILTTVSSTRT